MSANPGRNRRIGVVHAALALLALAVLAKSAHVQLVQGRAWSAVARRQHFTAATIPAARGEILDASGRTLATSRYMIRLEVAPRELRDPARARRALIAAGIDRGSASRATDKRNRWVVIPGRFVSEEVAPVTALRGVYATPVSDRAYAISPGLRPLVGEVDGEGNGIDGLELSLDSLLRGVDGAASLVRDVGGREFASPTVPARAPTPGSTIVLTIHHELQEIAERTLADAVARLDAEGGDIVILDPRDGAVLAMAGERAGKVARSVTAVTEPFEPGSTLKPFVAAALLARGKARTRDMVPTRGGTYELHGRTIHDEPHPGPTPAMLSLADVIRYSSNVGIAQFVQRLQPGEEYESLRDFGFGAPTLLPYASEASGTLRPPDEWSRQTPASMAMGYEIAVTPLQLALAYAAIANGGELLEPVLLREIRAPDGDVVFKQSRRVVRRVVSEEVARTIRGLLVGVVERGTAVDAELTAYDLGGKTGTPRRAVNGRYAPSQYNPNFVGIFPAEEPQLVVVVRLMSPRGDFYGGRTAAPMTKTIVQAALAARDAALDRESLAPRSPRGGSAVQSGRPSVAAAARAAAVRKRVATDSARTILVHLDSSMTAGAAPTRALPARAVPDVRGMSLRSAVRELHAAGFRVQLTLGAIGGTVTDPAAGSLVRHGSLVRLRHER